MTKRGKGFSGGNHRKFSSNAGYEIAKKHIKDAKAFSAKLGGIDRDVKGYFFSLSPAELKRVFEEYEREHGEAPRKYAEETFAEWKTGRRQMSGLVAMRLFSLLPPLMTFDKKFELVEKLWKHLGPKSSKTLTVGYDVSPQILIDAVATNMLKEVRVFKIPESMGRQFEWLSSGDVELKQDLLNRIQEVQRSAIMSGTELQIPALLQHLNSPEGQSTKAASQEIGIGNHRIRLEFERGHSGISEGSIRSSKLTKIIARGEESWLSFLGDLFYAGLSLTFLAVFVFAIFF